MPYKVHRVFEKPPGTQWNTDNYTDEDRQIAADYVTNVINVQPGYNGEVEKTFINENTMKLSYTLYSSNAAQRFVRSICDDNNPYYVNFRSITSNGVRYKITSFIEDENGNTVQHGPIINPSIT